MDRLSDVFYKNAHLQSQLIAQAVTDDFCTFNNGSLQGKDDITFLVLQVERPEQVTQCLHLASDFGELKSLQEVVSTIVPGYKEMGMFVTCLIELVANAIEHGNRFDPDKTVTVELSTVDGCIEATVHDQGEGFGWREKIDRPLELDGSEERGRGIAMTRICCDRLFYNEKGNRVTFTVTTREGGK
jgi:anti-sigma regulatory factor (Ser/Thr protein kinase)